MMIPVEYWPLVTAVLVFIAIMLLGWGWIMNSRYQAQRKEMIQKIQYSSHNPPNRLDAPGGTAESGAIVSFLGKLGKSVAYDKVMDPTDTRIRFLKAGLRGEKAPAVFWGVKVMLVTLAPLAFLLVNKVITSLPPAKFMMWISLLALIAFYLPDLWLYNRSLHRKEDILDAFPDALDLMVVCVEAGMGLDAAITRVAQEIGLDSPILSEELAMFSLEMRAGLLRRDALKNLAMRTDLLEINRLTALLIQTDRFGTSVANSLKVFSDTLRTQRYQKAEELAGKIPVKIMVPLILFIFPALFVVILGPAVIRISHTLLLK